jgi:hypothetical protein
MENARWFFTFFELPIPIMHITEYPKSLLYKRKIHFIYQEIIKNLLLRTFICIFKIIFFLEHFLKFLQKNG